MARSTDRRAGDGHGSLPDRPLQRGSDVGLVAMAFMALSLTGLVSCIGWGVRPESALIMAPADEVWTTALDVLREREFKIDQQDSTAQTLQATREIFIKMVSDRKTPTTAQKVRHQVDISVKAAGDGRSVLEVIYRIDKLVDEDEAFRLLQSVRDRVAISGGGGTPIPPRR
ncbi:MAG TPA: hypothetical protein VJM10_06000 [Candidatus Methylomirabilis sp.]|nr:hypothetical protein [Candidatus Methylomirabilis sp.]